MLKLQYHTLDTHKLVIQTTFINHIIKICVHLYVQFYAISRKHTKWTTKAYRYKIM